MQLTQNKNQDYYSSELIPPTAENFRKILLRTYRRFLYLPLFLITISSFTVLPFIVLFFVLNEPLLAIALPIVMTGVFVGPIIHIQVVFKMAKKNPNASFRKHGYLADLQQEAV